MTLSINGALSLEAIRPDLGLNVTEYRLVLYLVVKLSYPEVPGRTEVSRCCRNLRRRTEWGARVRHCAPANAMKLNDMRLMRRSMRVDCGGTLRGIESHDLLYRVGCTGAGELDGG